MESLTIGQLAKAAGVRVGTIRFYERAGLVPDPRRSPSGYRQYGHEAVRRIHFIKRAKGLGFTLAEVGELLCLRDDPRSSCGDVLDCVHGKIADIDEELGSLERMKAHLIRIAETCPESGPARSCPILAALDAGDEEH